MAKFKTHYDNLNVSRNAPASVIKAAYKALCQKYHPDKFSGGHDEAVRIMKTINAAYAVLSDTGKRAEHDQWIDRQEREHATSEAHRIMEIITKNYVAPSATVKNESPTAYRITINKFWNKICDGGKKLRFISSRLSKKINGFFWLAAAACIVFAAIMLYMPDLKTTSVAPVNQDVAKILRKAELLVKQGRTAKALPLYLQLAEQGNVDAQFHAGLIYANGQGVTKDDKLAACWIDKAAKQGHREAQTKLGFMYATGKGVEKNYSSAIYWCYKAAEQGDAIAQYNLGLMYAKGQGVAKDNNIAASWYSKAAAQGDARAQYYLADMYAKGEGVAKDDEQAVVLYRKAAEQGSAEAIAALKQLEDK